jgi:hypothetical protein
MSYRIEKRTPGVEEEIWESAWGLKPRSFPKASDDAEAVAIFRRETARCRVDHRIVRLDGYGYTAQRTVLANHPEVQPAGVAT